MNILIRNAEIYTPSKHIQNGFVLIEGSFIREVGKGGRVRITPEMQVIDAGGRRLIPGLIDTHIHGAGGHDMTGSGLREAAQYLGQRGITGFLATTHFLLPHQDLEAAVSEMAEVIDHPPAGAKILGIHMEGPWIAPDRSPFSDPDLCYPITCEDVEVFQQAANGHVRMVTFAPELDGALNIIPWLNDHHITASIGHTNADYETVVRAVELGLNHSTHTYNAMQPFHHRQPSALGAIFERAEIRAELIADGFHVHPSAMRLLIKAKGPDNVCLVSDAVPIAGLPAGTELDWLGFRLFTDGRVSTFKDGRPAGAYQLLNQNLKVLVDNKVATFSEAVRMASTTPARMLNLNKGQLSAGCDADIVILDENYVPVLTMVEGLIIYSEIS